jgi:hypothetical protein
MGYWEQVLTPNHQGDYQRPPPKSKRPKKVAKTAGFAA